MLEQQVVIDDDAGQPLLLRCIELHLDTSTEDGDTVIRLLTNLPQEKIDAKQAAQLYRRRWRIETMFQRLESVLNNEITTLGQPRAALLAFGAAVLAYNVLAVLQAAVTAQHKLEQAGEIELSAYYLALEIRAHYAGMMVAVALTAWQAYDVLTPKQLARTLLQMAGKADPRKLRKHPRGPKLLKTNATCPQRSTKTCCYGACPTGWTGDLMTLKGVVLKTERFIFLVSSVPTFFRGERADLARNSDLNLLRVA